MSPDARRRIHPVVALILVALVPAVLLAALWRWAAARATDGGAPATDSSVAAAGPPLSTPLLSFRRAPAVLARDVNAPAFEEAVASFGDTLEDTSCLAVSLDGVAVGGARAAETFIPASNMKLLVGAVALEVLGPERRFTTEVRAAPVTDGVVAGDLFIVGGGDPLLTSSSFPVQDDRFPVTSPTSLDALADAVVAAGVKRVDGAVLGDASRYDDELFAPSWDHDIRGIEAGPIDALIVNDARVTGDGGRATDPAEAAAREMTRLLTDRGVVVAGAPAAGVAPTDGGVAIASVSSAPLTDVVGELLGTSDNNTAEMLVKELGLASGSGGTREAGLAVVRSTLESWGLPMGDMVLADGSGLSNDNRVSCDVFVGVLGRTTPDGPLGAGLPVAGRSGTLSDLFGGSAVAGRLRAKTGTLGNAPFDVDPPAVKSLSGYLPVDGGGVITFSLLLNGPGALSDERNYVPIWQALVDALATYPTGPTAADLAPATN